MLNEGPSPQRAMARSVTTFSPPCSHTGAAADTGYGGSKCERGCHSASLVPAGAQCGAETKLARGDRGGAGLRFAWTKLNYGSLYALPMPGIGTSLDSGPSSGLGEGKAESSSSVTE